MASEDSTEEKRFVIAPLQWGSILAAVKDQIPTLDSDTSVSDGDEGEEDLFIFQRDEPNLIPDLTEELQDSPPEESYLQKTFAFMRNPNRDPEIPDKRASPVFLDQEGFYFLPEKRSSQDAASPSEAPRTEEERPGEGIARLPAEGRAVNKEKGRLSSSPDTSPSVQMSPSSTLNASAKERRQLIETQILSKATVGSPAEGAVHPEPKNTNNNAERKPETVRELRTVPAEQPQELTLLAFKDIDMLDLDKVLQHLEKPSGDTSWTFEMDFPLVNPETARNLSQARLMGKLEALALEQSRAFWSQQERCLAKLPEFSRCQGDGKGVPSLWSNRSPTPEELQCAPEPPTVYMDLRDAAPQCPEVTRDEELSSSHSSSSDDEEDVEERGPENRGTKPEAFPHPLRDCTGKSFLLQQLRHFRGKMPQSSAIGEPTPKPPSPEGTDFPSARRSLKEGSLASEGPKWSAKSVPPGRADRAAQKPKELKRSAEEEPGFEPPRGASAHKGAFDPRRKANQKEK